MSKAATMEIPINSNGDTGTLPEDDSLEQVGPVHCVGWRSVLCNIYTRKSFYMKTNVGIFTHMRSQADRR